jgi:uncharacterized protein RhaS with RHS repeats
LTGTVNTAGSTIVKVFGDGAEVVYTYDTATSQYISTDGAGAHDTLSYNSSTTQWAWTDGSTRHTEVYDSNGRLLSSRDSDGNTVSYGYTGNLLTQVTDASGQTTFFDYSNNNLAQIRTVVSGVTQTRVRYGYDTSNRLQTVTVDLSPTDNSIADGRTYVTSYSYDGTSKRIASITQTDGSSVSFTYELAGGIYRVKTYTDAENRTTTLNYTSTNGSGSGSVTANPNALSSAETQAPGQRYNLISGALTSGAAWSAAASLEGSANEVSDPQLAPLYACHGHLGCRNRDRQSHEHGLCTCASHGYGNRRCSRGLGAKRWHCRVGTCQPLHCVHEQLGHAVCHRHFLDVGGHGGI